MKKKPVKRDFPEEVLRLHGWMSYQEVALICRRASGTIENLASRHHIPRVKVRGAQRRNLRFVLFPIESVKRLRKLTLGF